MSQFLSWEAIEAIVRGAHRVLLYGPPGTGKTRAAFEASKDLNKSLYNVTLTEETPAAELRGHFIPQGTKFVWMDGPAVRAFREGAMLCLDEIDKASQDCLDFLHGLLNDLEMAQLTLPSGEIVRPASGFQVVATMNGELEDLIPSLQDRFSIAIEVSKVHPNAIAALPDDLQGAAQNIESYDDVRRPVTLRRFHAFATLRELPGISIEQAAQAVFAHRAHELLDAFAFRTEEPMSGADETDPCLCTDCKSERAWAWLSHEHSMSELRFDSSDDTWQCPQCGGWFSSENDALLCCYDDRKWIDDCKENGRDFK